MITSEERLRFESLCRTVAAEGLEGGGIGTVSEKRMHKTLKRYICPDEGFHEARIKADGVAYFSENEFSAIYATASSV